MMEPRIGILAFEQMRAKLDIGSTRIRAVWLTRYWSEAELFTVGRLYSAVIFQKAYWLDYAREFSGVKILDVCDPEFLHWDSDCIAMARHCNVVTTSSQALATTISQYTSTPTIYIPDRLDLECFRNFKKNHLGKGIAQTVAWFGYSKNFSAVDASVPDLLRLGVRRLIVISEKPGQYKLPREAKENLELITLQWNFDTVLEHLLEADVVLNYQLDLGRWKYKSNNKTIFAWAVGLPVAHSGAELATWMSENARVGEAAGRLLEVSREYDIRESVRQYRGLVDRFRANRLES